jgi:hypothetical protein
MQPYLITQGSNDPQPVNDSERDRYTPTHRLRRSQFLHAALAPIAVSFVQSSLRPFWVQPPISVETTDRVAKLARFLS